MKERAWWSALAVAALLPGLAGAEIKQASPDGVIFEHRFELSAAPADAWAVLVHPERYWPNDHTWSGNAANMSLKPEAGGCFCEQWDGGSAEHGRVVMAMPGKLLRFRGSLGPFQEMAVTGIMTVTLAATATGTTAVVTYRISGDASHKLDAFASVVDGVVRQQFAGFAALASQPRE
ncbi:MAG: hypothetical protein QG601_569 [Pseudomonadota bacterium]|nr:hypothetical protein [Pseudomonadota bacterium]